ncbi:MAG: Metalloprotease PmbA [Acidimicrobiales bacterium]|nr:MAG: TldD/PmbA family protein [Actinomycetota bacterium]MBV6508104.1 Metalloprotease PmbA [Acidimicrobiales bacterium]RIK03850.1 MAG: TldD/PmbA family protein [Acidobacteriota bacterium]
MSDLLELGDRIVAAAQGDEQVEAVVLHSQDTEVRVYEGEVESFSSAESRGVGIRVVKNGRQGFAYAGTFDEDALFETLAEARDNAEFGTQDEWAGLAEPDGVDVADLELFDARLVGFPTEKKIELAIELEKATVGADSRITGVESAEYVDAMADGAIVTTTGIRTSGRETGCYVAAYALAEDEGETQTGFGFSVARQPGELDPAKAASDSAERATRLLGATKPASERLTVVFDPFVTAQFISIITDTLSAEAVLKGRSLFAERIGEEVASPSITLVDDPLNVEAFTATETDGEGLAARRNVMIRGGVLEQFLHNAYTARAMGTVSTGSAVRGGFKSTPTTGAHAAALAPGELAPEEIYRKVGEGLLIQGVAGIHSGVNPVSGDFSTGAEGLRITGGEPAGPVREFTIASTIQKMLKEVVAVGSDLEWLPMDAAGLTLAIADVTVSGS